MDLKINVFTHKGCNVGFMVDIGSIGRICMISVIYTVYGIDMHLDSVSSPRSAALVAYIWHFAHICKDEFICAIS